MQHHVTSCNIMQHQSGCHAGVSARAVRGLRHPTTQSKLPSNIYDIYDSDEHVGNLFSWSKGEIGLFAHENSNK